MADPQTFWLSVTNAALGFAVVFCLVTVLVAAIYEVAARLRRAVTSLGIVRDLAPRRALHRVPTGPSANVG